MCYSTARPVITVAQGKETYLYRKFGYYVRFGFFVVVKYPDRYSNVHLLRAVSCHRDRFVISEDRFNQKMYNIDCLGIVRNDSFIFVS